MSTNMIRLEAPFTPEKIRQLKVGDQVLISGTLHTGRDAVHKYLHDGGKLPVSWKNGILYHCGPVVIEKNGKYQVVAAGPTTSIREEPYEYDVIRQYGLTGIIGKGGMGPKTLKACQEFGCAYLHAIGGAAQVLAECVEEVTGVYLKDIVGSPEAIWELRVRDFPVVVTMDASGRSLHAELLESSGKILKSLIG